MSKISLRNKLSYEVLKKLVCLRRDTAVKKGQVVIDKNELVYLKKYLKITKSFQKSTIVHDLNVPQRRYFFSKNNATNMQNKNYCQIITDSFEIKVIQAICSIMAPF